MTRPDLVTAVGAAIAEQQQSEPDRFDRTGYQHAHYERLGAQLDQLADRAAADPAWLNTLSDYDRSRITNWAARRAHLANTTNPKDAA